MYCLKRVIDFCLVFCALVICCPVLFIIALWLHFANKGAGAFFLQERPGRHGKIFKVIKFKTHDYCSGGVYLVHYLSFEA